MAIDRELRIAVLPGDGIGPEVMAPCLDLLARVQTKVGGFALGFEEMPAGAGHYRDHGIALPESTLERAGRADAILLAAMGLPEVRYPDGREIAPQLDLREVYVLYAGVRPVRTYPGLPVPLADPRAQSLDMVLIRESTEGLFKGRGQTQWLGNGTARDVLEITRGASERLFEFAFALARQRKARGAPGRVTCVDKANVLGAFRFFREIFEEVAARHEDLEADWRYVDATALSLIRNPWDFDVLVTENMFGDILSDAGAALMGGMGSAPSADIGDRQAVFQPCHGTAPDIVGSGKANPTAMFLSAAMMLDWLGETTGEPQLTEAAGLLDRAVTQAYADGGLRPFEMGGTSGLREVTDAVIGQLGSAA